MITPSKIQRIFATPSEEGNFHSIHWDIRED